MGARRTMAMAFGLALLALPGSVGAGLAASGARMHSQTDVRYYPIAGGSELALLRDMRRNGPRVGGRAALASTRMRARYAALLEGKAGACRVRKLNMQVQYTITLPRLRPHARVLQSVRRHWPGFLRKLRRHENHHIAIWNDCLRLVRRRLPRMRARDCTRLKHRLRAAYERIMAECGKRHDAFDQRERHAAASLPFIRAAFRLAGKHGRAAAARRQQRPVAGHTSRYRRAMRNLSTRRNWKGDN